MNKYLMNKYLMDKYLMDKFSCLSNILYDIKINIKIKTYNIIIKSYG